MLEDGDSSQLVHHAVGRLGGAVRILVNVGGHRVGTNVGLDLGIRGVDLDFGVQRETHLLESSLGVVLLGEHIVYPTVKSLVTRVTHRSESVGYNVIKFFGSCVHCLSFLVS